jgi:hypothetical protein
MQNGTWWCSSWVGLSGDPSGDIFQAGFESKVIVSGRGTISNPDADTIVQTYAWWQWWPEAKFETSVDSLRIFPGDTWTVALCMDPGSTTAGTVYFTPSDPARGPGTSFHVTAPLSGKLVGNSAEWIVERPYDSTGVVQRLADFGVVRFTDALARSTGNKSLAPNPGTGTNINMIASKDNPVVIASGSIPASQEVECKFK